MLFANRSFRLQWLGDLLTSCAFEMETLILGWYVLSETGSVLLLTLLGGSDPGRLSQEWLVDNSTQAEGCNGGYFDSADNFVIPRGQPLWSACPHRCMVLRSTRKFRCKDRPRTPAL